MKKYFIAFVLLISFWAVKSQSAEDYYNQAALISGNSKNELKQKIELLNKAVASKENYTEALLLRASTYVEQNSLKEALNDYSSLIKSDSLNASYYKLRAIVYVKKAEPENAINDYTKAYQCDTSMIDCIYERGNIYNEFFNGKQLQNAIDDFNFCIANTSIHIKSKAYVGKGRVMENMEQFEKALIDYNTALKVNPLNAEAYLYRGILKIALNQDGCYDLLKYREMNGADAQNYLNQYCTK